MVQIQEKVEAAQLRFLEYECFKPEKVPPSIVDRQIRCEEGGHHDVSIVSLAEEITDAYSDSDETGGCLSLSHSRWSCCDG